MSIFDIFTKKNKEQEIPPGYGITIPKPKPDVCEWTKGGRDSIYSNVRFLQWWSYSRKNLDKISYPMWMQYECEIQDSEAKTQDFIKNGYLEESDFKSSLSSYLVKELQSILKSQNLSTSGKKQELIDRICENADLSLIKKPRVYVLSQKGKDYLEQYSEVLTAESFRAYDISIDEYFATKKKLNNIPSPNNILWHIFNENIIFHSKNKNFGSLRSVYFSMAKYCEKESRFIESERYYCAALRYDLSGLGNGNTYSFRDIYIVPAVVLGIRKHKEYYDENEVLTFCQKIYLPRSIADFKTFKKVLSDIFNDELLTPEDYIPKRKRPKETVIDDGIWEMSDEEIRKILDETDEELGLKGLKKNR